MNTTPDEPAAKMPDRSETTTELICYSRDLGRTVDDIQSAAIYLHETLTNHEPETEVLLAIGRLTLAADQVDTSVRTLTGFVGEKAEVAWQHEREEREDQQAAECELKMLRAAKVAMLATGLDPHSLVVVSVDASIKATLEKVGR